MSNNIDDTIGDHNQINVSANFNESNSVNPNIGSVLRIMQLNIEGISKQKYEVLEKQLYDENIAAIQETDLIQEGPRSEISGFTMVASHHHAKFGIATYIKDDLLPFTKILHSTNTIHVGIKIHETTIINVYKPPSATFAPEVLPKFEKPSIVLGDFNSHHTLWGYPANDTDGLKVAVWMARDDYSLLYNATDPGTFHSRRWNQSYSPDLCFVSRDLDGQIMPATRRVLRGFPNSQHGPIIIQIGLQLPLTRANNKNKWNFSKAIWDILGQIVDKTIQRIPATPTNYDRFVGLLLSAAKKSIPRGRREAYIPGCSHDSQALYDAFNASGNVEIGKQLLHTLDENRKRIWEEKMNSVNFASSSRKAWSTLHRLCGRSHKSRNIFPVTPNDVASQLIKNSKGLVSNQQKKRVDKRYIRNFRNCQRSSNISSAFTTQEINNAIATLKSGKAPGFDHIFPDYLKHLGPKATNWLTHLFNCVKKTNSIFKSWKKAKVIAILKQNKPPEEATSYRPISLLSNCYKLFEKCLLARIKPIIDDFIPKEQAGFQQNRNCCDQVLALTNFIELGFEKCLKTGVVFVDLTAAYHTVRNRA